jgi:hypothetical protein
MRFNPAPRNAGDVRKQRDGEGLQFSLCRENISLRTISPSPPSGRVAEAKPKPGGVIAAYPPPASHCVLGTLPRAAWEGGAGSSSRADRGKLSP